MDTWDEFPDVASKSAEPWDAFPPAKEKPLVDISDTLSGAGHALSGLTTTVPHAFRQLGEGLENPWKRSEGYKSSAEAMQKYNEETEAAEKAAEESGDASVLGSGMRQAGSSLGFSGGAMGASLLGGSATGTAGRYIGGLAGPEGAIAGEVVGRGLGALGASYGAAYRMAGAQFLDEAKNELEAKFQKHLGRPMTEKEQDEAYAELKPLAEKFGHAEAGPEAIGNLAMGLGGKYVLGLGRKTITKMANTSLLKTGAKKLGAGAAAEAVELGGETATQVEQNRIEKEKQALLSGQEPSTVAQPDRSVGEYWDAFKEVAPATVAQSLLGLGAGTVYKGIKSAIPTAPKEEAAPEGTPAPVTLKTPVVVNGVTIADIPADSDLTPDQVADFADDPETLKKWAARGQINLPEVVAPIPGVDTTAMDENIAASAALAPQTAEVLAASQNPSEAPEVRAAFEQPQVSPVTTETETPSNTANVAGGSQSVQTEPAEGSIPAVTDDIVSTSDIPSTAEIQPTQDDATNTVGQRESVYREPAPGDQSRETESPGAGDQLLSAEEERGQAPSEINVWAPQINEPATFTAPNGQPIVGTIESVSPDGTKARVTYPWNGKTVTGMVPVSQLGRPVAALTEPPRYQYTQEQNARKAGKFVPTQPGIYERFDFRQPFAKMAQDTSLSRFYRDVARVLSTKPEFADIDFHVVADGRQKFAGEYSHHQGRSAIAVNLRQVARGRVDAVGTILHEALHHETLAKVRDPQTSVEQEAVAALDQIRKRVKAYAGLKEKATKFDYELGTNEEFITGLFTRPDFQDFLASIPDDFSPTTSAGKFRSLLSEIFRLIAQLVTGKHVAKGSSMEQAMTSILALFETPHRTIETGYFRSLNAAPSRQESYQSPSNLLADTAAKLRGEAAEKPAGLSSMFNPKEKRPATGERTLFETPKPAAEAPRKNIEVGPTKKAVYVGGRAVPVGKFTDNLTDTNAANGKDAGSNLGTANISDLKGVLRLNQPEERRRVDALKQRILSDEGHISPIIVSAQGDVIEGQHRLAAMRELGATEMPVAVSYEASDFIPDVEALKKSLSGFSLRRQQVDQMVSNVAEMLRDEKGDAKELSFYDMPKPFDEAFKTAVVEVQRQLGVASDAGIPTTKNQPVNVTTAYQKAQVGRSTAWVPIKDVYEQAKQDDPSLTPEAFMAQINEQNDKGDVYISPVEQLSTVQAAQPFVVGAAGVEMLVPGATPMSEAESANDLKTNVNNALESEDMGALEKLVPSEITVVEAVDHKDVDENGRPSRYFFLSPGPPDAVRPLLRNDVPRSTWSLDENSENYSDKDVRGWLHEVLFDSALPKSAFQNVKVARTAVQMPGGEFQDTPASAAEEDNGTVPPTIDIGGEAEPATGEGKQLYQKEPTAIGKTYATPADITLQEKRTQEETLAAARTIIAENVKADGPIKGRRAALDRFRLDTSIPPEVRAVGTGLIAQQADLLANLEEGDQQLLLDEMTDEAAKLSGIFESDPDSFKNLKADANLNIDKMAEEAGRTLNIFNVFRRLTPEGFLRRMTRKYNDAVREKVEQNFDRPAGEVENEIARLWRMMQEAGASKRGEAIAAALKAFMPHMTNTKKIIDALFPQAGIRDRMNKGGEALVRNFFQMMAGPRDAKGPLAEFDESIQNALSSMLRKVMEAKGLVAKNESAQMTDIDKMVRSVSGDELRFDKIAAADEAMQKELADIEDPERRAVLQQAWEEATSKMYTNIASDATVRRAINAELKGMNVNWNKMFDEGKNPAAIRTKVVDATMGKIEALLTNPKDPTVQNNLKMLRDEVGAAFDFIAGNKHTQWLAYREAVEARRRVAERRKDFMAALHNQGVAEQAINRISEKLAGPQRGKPDQNPVSALVGEHMKAAVPDFVNKLVALDVDRTTAEQLDKAAGTLRSEIAAAEKLRAADKAVADLMKSLKPKPRAPREKIEKSLKTLFTADTVGALDSQAFFDAFGEAFGLPPLSGEQQAKVKKLVREVNSLPKGPARLDKQQELDEELALWKGIAARDVLLSAWYANILSGVSTQGMGVFGNSINLFLRSAFNALSNPRSAAAYFKGAFGEGLATGIEEAKAALKGRGLYKVSKYGDKNLVNALELLRKKGPSTLPEWVAYIASAGTRLRYVFRIMQAIDALAWNTAREGHAYLAAHRALLEQQKQTGEKLSPEEFYKQFVDSLGGDTAQIEEDLRNARQTLVDAGKVPDLLTVDRMAREARNARRAAGGIKGANRFADRIVLQQEPEGSGKFITSLIDAFQKKGDLLGLPLGQMLVPFNKIVSNLFEQSLDYTPVGALRAILGGHLSDLKSGSLLNGKVEFKEKAQLFDQMERRERGMAAVAGMSAAAIAFALANAYKDDPDEDVPFMVYGWGPESKTKRSQMPKGWQPYSVKIGDQYYKFSEMPFGMLFAAAGSAMDAVRYKNMDKKTASERLGYVLKTAAKGFMNQGVMSSLDNAMESLMFQASDKKITDIPVNAVKGLVPAQGLLRDISSIFDPNKVSNESLTSALLRDIPFAKGYATKPDLNVFGEPVKMDGYPIVRRLITHREPHAVADYLGRNDLHIPGMEQTIEIGKYLPKQTHDRIKRRAIELGAMENGLFTPEQNYEFKKRAGQLTKAIVEDVMKAVPKVSNDAQRKLVQGLIDKRVENARRRAMLEAVPVK